MTKKCCRCKASKNESEYQRDRQKKDGLRPNCKACTSLDYIKSRDPALGPYRPNGRIYQDSTSGIFHRHLKRKYGITTEQYAQMFNEQKGCCAICDAHQDRLSRKLSVDHNHMTGHVRGLLCWECNAAIGKLRSDDGVQLLQKAINYINKSNSGSADQKQSEVAEIIQLKKRG